MPRLLCAVLSCGPLLAGPLAAQAAAQTLPPITLGDALTEARAQSPARQASAARVEAADASRRLAGRLVNPVAELRWENWAPGLRDTLPLDAFATLTQPLELGGKRAARVGLAAAAAEGARAAFALTGRDLDADVARRFLAVVRERDRGRTLAVQAEGLGEIVRILERRVAEGVTAEADLRKIETERARVDTDAALAAIRAARELAVLAALTGWSPPPPADALDRPALAAPAADRDALIARALLRRPDVQLATARLESSRQALAAEQARRIPDLNVTAGLKHTAGYRTGVVGVLVPIPLFDRNRAAVILARGHVAAAELELEQTRRLAAGEARAAMEAAEGLARRSQDATARLVDPAAVVRTAARAAFESGAGDLLRLVDAERVYADARIAVNDLSVDALLAALDARLALAEEMVP